MLASAIGTAHPAQLSHSCLCPPQLCYQHSPHAFEHTVKYEAHQRLKAILMPKAMFDPVMAMAPPEPVVTRRHTMTQPGG